MTENEIEKFAIALLENQGYTYINGVQLALGFKFVSNFKNSLKFLAPYDNTSQII
jgi:TPP-dependent trihydroxycyclohexane-1,2-dione (THcHDO) dehydratase